ncbi:DUF1028 domain-containing protein [Natronocalculus amylovorans]|uniref:DUF1028 domain-containing protein n=1 Tax=Natronocalculus amylovorans TaxID=2917812 RepID=A0AAE3KAT7_9EURY|nr:DUF1028 domain-containing protein [Natronocalculus amylovorans]MCL9818515.1 DUF1028 domain-containing protein [Natronocalculus amylovorans]
MPPRPSTFSIVARDPDTDAIGVAVQSKFISVGSVVPFVSADAGAIATQSFANVAYGSDGLSLLRDGHSAETVIEKLTAVDDEAPSRQVGIVGQDGSVAGYTGTECFDVAGDLQGDTYTVQGNILENEETLHAMADAYKTTSGGLPEKLLASLHAGNEAGGDKRGEQSAALYIAKPNGGYDGLNDRWVDVRVDDHESPIDELERVFKIYDVTLLERETPSDLKSLSGAPAEAVLEILSALSLYDGTPKSTFSQKEQDALVAFRGLHNFENHSLSLLEDSIQRGWAAADGTGEDRIVDAIWHGLSRLDRL